MRRSAWFVPGRIEVFGKHTDYGGGRSLLAATEQGITLHGVVAEEGVSVASAAGGDRYVASVLAGLKAALGSLAGGARITVTSSLPAAAGLSSSSAFVTGLVLVLADLWDLALPAGAELVEFVAQIERGVGVDGGAEDHAAILLCQAGHLLPCRFGPTRPEPPVPWPRDHVFVVAVSGVVAEKALGARERYNRTAGVLAGIAQQGITLSALLDSPADVETAAAGLEPAAARRVRQFVEESAVIVPAAASAVARGDWAVLGTIARRSHALGREALGNAVPETEALTERALALGAVAASPFGAGFGGSVWAVVEAKDAGAFARAWHRETLTTRPARGAHRLEG